MRKKKIIIVILIGIIVSGIVLMYSSYALFQANQISKSAITIKAGTMNGTLKVDGTTTNKLTLAKGTKQTFIVTLENLNSIEGKFIPYYSGTIPDGVTFGYLESTGVDVPIETTLSKNGKKTYSIYFENNSTSSVTINLGVQGGLSNQPLSLPTNSYLIPQALSKNNNITNVWKYDQTTGSSTFCVTGEESTCLSINPKTFETGTIIKYKVNDTTEKYFHVISDDGDTLTLQQRENTINNVAWGNTSDSVKKPTIVLESLEDATKNWSNVMVQTYTLGETVFMDNAFTGCNDNNECTTNAYTLPQRISRARLVTAQELLNAGCVINQYSCPIWAHNYLKVSTDNGGTENDPLGTSIGYWTSSIYPANSQAYYIPSSGMLGHSYAMGVTGINAGARAVIKVKKYQGQEAKPANSNITKAYYYNQNNNATKCITGEEESCVLKEDFDTYTPGTIVKYKVNDTKELYFYVISDNRNTLTLQQRENTVDATKWYSTDETNKGPITILEALESATSLWTNVLEQTYSLGSTNFNNNPYTGCTYDSTNKTFLCNANIYSLGSRKAKARMLTLQEASQLGCIYHSLSCPVWMYNYLERSTSNGGTVNQGSSWGYWLSSALNSTTSKQAWNIYYYGFAFYDAPSLTNFGARAVVVVNK